MTSSHTSLNAGDTGELPLRDSALAGRYKVLGVLARGGHGVVLRAETVAGEPRAIKVLHPELGTAREAALRFEREFNIIRRPQEFCHLGIEPLARRIGGRVDRGLKTIKSFLLD